MTRKQFEASLPRRMHWSDEVGGHTLCPDCGGLLESQHQAYLSVTLRGGDVAAHIVENAAGSFCKTCPVVVLNRKRLEMLAALSARGRGGTDFIVMGIVDLDAVPEDKKGLPFDEATNPVPLVSFTNVDEKGHASNPD